MNHTSEVMKLVTARQTQSGVFHVPSVSKWRACSWHVVAKLLHTGKLPRSELDNPGYEVYEMCLKHGAFVATGHDHVYARSHLLDSFTKPNVVSTSAKLQLERGRSFVFVNGLGGMDIRAADPKQLERPWWAKAYHKDNHADYGALFCVLNKGGVEDEGECYFKTVKNKTLDSFKLVSRLFEGVSRHAPAGECFSTRTPK